MRSLGFVLVATAMVTLGCRRSEEPSPTTTQVTHSAPMPYFRDVASQAGIDTVLYCGGADKDHILESVGSGAAMVDLDNDGRLDIYLVNAWLLDESPSRVRVRGRNILYRNLGDGRFENVTERAGVGDDAWGCGVCAGDYDNDGKLDLYVANFGPNRLYRNLGDGTFEEVADRAGVADPGWGAGVAFFDADGDGDLDLYVANYLECTMEEVLAARRTNRWRDKVKVMTGPFGMRGGKDRFYRNNGDGTFTDATDAAGLTDTAEGYGLGVVASDLDNDGDVDLYVANDSNPNFLYRNEGRGTFTEIGGWCGAGFSADGAAQAGMGVDAADLDGDGLQELFVTNFARDHCTLYHNVGDLFFDDVSAAKRIKSPTFAPLSWGCAFFDPDLDADLDLIIVNGHIYPQVDEIAEFGESYRQLPVLLRNDAGRLTDITDQAGPGMRQPVSGRGLALGDYDDDGRPDLLITCIDMPPLLLHNEATGTGHWAKVRVLNRHGSPAINALVTVTADGRVQMRELRSGSTYQSQSAMELHFGVGPAMTIDSVEVRWLSGRTEVRRQVPVDQTMEFREP